MKYKLCIIIIIVIVCAMLIIYYSISFINIAPIYNNSISINDYWMCNEYEKLFGIHKNNMILTTNMLFEGKLWSNTNIDVDMYLVDSGKIVKKVSYSLGCSTGYNKWISSTSYKATISLIEIEIPNCDIVAIVCKAPASVGAGSMINLPKGFFEKKKSYTRNIYFNKKEIIHVEGSREIDIDSGMSIESFMNKYREQYLLITAQLQ
jgi:hypothetical protein